MPEANTLKKKKRFSYITFYDNSPTIGCIYIGVYILQLMAGVLVMDGGVEELATEVWLGQGKRRIQLRLKIFSL